MAVDQDLDQLLRRAIEEKRLLRFSYKGSERIAEPHDYGIQSGLVRLLCWQVSGQSQGRIPGWRLIDVDGMQSCEMLENSSVVTERSLPADTIDGMKSLFVWDCLGNRDSGKDVRTGNGTSSTRAD